MSALWSRTGRVLVASVLIASLAYVGKLYYAHETRPETVVRAGEIEALLGAMSEALEAREGQAGAAPLGTAPWTPATLPCGVAAPVPPEEAAHPTWRALGWAPKDAPTRHQLRYLVTPDGFEVIARSDFDCDGLHQVFRLRGERGALGLKLAPVTIDNPGE